MTDQIDGTITHGITLVDGGNYSSPLTVNAHIIPGFYGGGDALDTDPSVPWTILNNGILYANGSHTALDLAGGGSVANNGYIQGGAYGIHVGFGLANNIDNFKGISAFGTHAQGVAIQGYGTLTNESGGTIVSEFEGVVGSNITVINDGKIAAYIDAGVIARSVTNGAGGVITGSTGRGVITSGNLLNNGTIIANKGVWLSSFGVQVLNTGTISGTKYGVYGTGTVENAGTIAASTSSGSYAIFLTGYTDRLIIDPGAVFTGAVKEARGTGTIELKAGGNGTLNGLGTKYTGWQTVTIDSGASWEVAGTLAGFSGSTIQGFHTGDLLDITDLAYTAGDTATYSSGYLTIYNIGHTSIASVAMTGGDFGGHTFNMLSDGNGGSFVEEDGTPCYCRGTLILTAQGEVKVERLKIGDLLVTRSGALRPVRWIGMRAYGGRFALGNKNILPVKIAAGALGENVPRRDLFVSPLHAMYLDEVLIPASSLINGTSITQARSVESVEYFHVELETHDVIMAEGALAETFLDDDSRLMFQNAAEYRRLYPDSIHKPAEYCAPVVEDGEILEAVRAKIAARAAEERAVWAA